MKKRFQHQVVFWVDLNDPRQAELADYIAELKSHRQFAPSVRAALFLLRDLRDGYTDALFELFPELQDEISTRLAPVESDNGGGKIETLLEKIDRLEQAMLAGNQPRQVSQSNGAGNAKQLVVPQFDLTTFDDDEDLFETEKIKDGQWNENFFKSLKNLQQ